MIDRDNIERKLYLLESLSRSDDVQSSVVELLEDREAESGLSLERMVNGLRLWAVMHPSLAVNLVLGVEREFHEAEVRRELV